MELEEEMAILFGSAITLLLGVLLWNKARLLKNGIRAEAVVVSNTRKHNNETNMYYPVVRFKTVKGEWITQELNWGRTPKLLEGKIVAILYDPNNLQTVAMDARFILKTLPVVLLFLGSIGCLLILWNLLK